MRARHGPPPPRRIHGNPPRSSAPRTPRAHPRPASAAASQASLHEQSFAPQPAYPLSRDAPPAALPGSYKLGEKVFFTGASHTFPSGNKLVHGQQGEVVGPHTGENIMGEGVTVLFPGNKGNVGCRLTQVRRRRAAPAAHPHAYVAPL